MPQSSKNTVALREEFATRLSKAIVGISRQEAAEKLGVSRQMLTRYLNGTATPGGEVIRKACAHWKLTLSVRGFEFTGDAFDIPRQRLKAVRGTQLNLLELLDKLRNDQLQAKIVGREGDSLFLELRIKVVA
jgi:transcriptional regulator with XRE-family HTH domain